ncbi:CHAT domain-containing protein [Nostoc sp. KVJ3]|uniref:CHAT domain-containing protein n=1 Tax=Nostoc sp. KVJ3 TaxID=457945 RepID=UPI0022381217|nr:CHAT domain-containing protein [Nostoc sp. KVJ3]
MATGQANRRTAPAVPFEHPFDKKALDDLRWYLEEYLRFPYGLAPDNAVKIEQKLQTWGEQLFELVFRSSEQARQFFQAATYEGLNQCELVIVSDNPEVLNLPWELLYSPSDRQFLAPSLAGMSRSLSDYPIRAEMGELPQDKLNILLVIARPYGEKDIALKTIARPLLDSISNIRKKVNIKVLRPPSFEQFERELNDKPGFYHIVHFDGHGNFDPDSPGFQHNFGAAGQGVLVFEAFDGSPQIITAAKIAQNLADCRVPIFVLNACKSAQEGEEKFSSVATRLVSLGAKGVVAMAYSVYAQAAKHFMGRLYGELAAGKSLSTAVSAGRKEVLNQPQRPSPKGDKPLQDWLVPVLYQQENYTPFAPANTVDDIESYFEETVSNLVNFPQEGRYGFIGRDYYILLLERAFRQNNIVLLQGMGGVGKTELAGGFARWLDETQGRSLIFFISFEHGATLSNVVNQVGRKVWGDKFSQYAAEKQQQAVLNYLKNQTCLLIWDNFEPVAGFPAGNEPLLSASERENLQRFIKDLRGGKSWVLITSRREESWLDCAYSLNLQGLREQDVEELAAKILQMVGVDRAKLPKEYLDLLKLLGGHPLSLRVILPHLKTQTPSQLIEALRLGLDTFSGAEEEGRDKSLTVSLDYSFTNLSEQARRHLPFLGLFSERVDAGLLAHISNKNPANPFTEIYHDVFGKNLQKHDWILILNEVSDAGILEPLGLNIYKIHPALPWYLRQKFSEYQSQSVISELEERLIDFYAGLAARHDQEMVGNAEYATRVLNIEEPNLLQNLRLAQQKQHWHGIHLILQALGELYERQGRISEFILLRKGVYGVLGIKLTEAKGKGKDAFALWRHLRGIDANDSSQNGDLDIANQIYQEILDELQSLNDESLRDEIAVFNHNLGHIAEQKRNLKNCKKIL